MMADMIADVFIVGLTVLFVGWIWFPKQAGREAARWHSKFLAGWREGKGK